jgi:RNase H-like domain found in reverse transcriptase
MPAGIRGNIALLAKDAFLWYLDHNKRSDIYCNASDLQLGMVILQEGVPVAFYSRKLTSVQHTYIVGEKELLSVVETLKEFRTMLYGCLTYTSIQTIRTIHSPNYKHNMFYDGDCS